MADLVIGEKLAGKLRKAARLQGQTVEEFIEAIVDRALPETSAEPIKITAPLGTLAALAEAADQANIRLSPDLTERSREILENEFPEYLKSRMNTESRDAD